jgi:hypothetical protein
MGSGDKPMIQVNVGTEEKTFAPEEISAMVRFVPFRGDCIGDN